MGQHRVSTYAGERIGLADDDGDEIGPRVACPHCDHLIPLRHAIGPQGRKPLTCPSCLRDVALPGDGR
jgi:hypothetical protein